MASLKEQLETLANNYTACDVSGIFLYEIPAWEILFVI
jgi:hypothetical protein